MEFTLIYEGILRSNGSVIDKHDIRRALHVQLKKLWNQLPLSEYKYRLKKDPPKGESSILKEVGHFRFAPLVTEELKLIAELSIIFLRPEQPGQLITPGGDIDNRLKTLFDALRMPKDQSELPNKSKPSDDENPLFCLLEDDSLITKVTVSTDRLLIDVEDDSHVHLLIHVLTKRILGTWGNIGLG
jgi:hypothetical protein